MQWDKKGSHTIEHGDGEYEIHDQDDNKKSNKD